MAEALGLAIPRAELMACMQCGMCVGSCPLTAKSKLNPRRIVGLLAMGRPPLEGAELWDCTTCYACGYRCPRAVKLLDVIVGLRSSLVEEGKVPSTIGEALENAYKQGNPWGRSRAKRADWAQGLRVKRASEGGVKVLLFTCCASAYDTRAQQATRALVELLGVAGVEVAILGEEEVCCGNEVYNLGEMGLFEELMSSNVEAINRCGPELIVTTSPHCYNAFKRRYRGLSAEVEHYTQYLSELIGEGRLRVEARLGDVLTYHDPCYLGRHNGVYDEPRRVLEEAVGRLVEMDRSRSRSVCCEGGGGRMWYEGPPGPRLSEARVREALDAGASILAVACPFCLANLEDAVKTVGVEDRLRVMDVAEVLLKAVRPSTT
ncbi:cyclic nucleotide-binding protein [Candidatus Geothermarchaeota archaeon ex4572_27]|nr:MAG: cyclic nucleotide-binding protein [Candidatus Geothermarchaeota archaeon ex4572_27]